MDLPVLYLDELLSGKLSSYFYVRDYPVPYLASQVIMSGFSHLAGPVAAGKIYLVIYFLFAGLLSVRFVQQYQLDTVFAYPLLLSCIVCNSSFWSGFINYQIGLLVLMGYLILSDSQKSKIWVSAIFSLLAFACHGFCLLAFGVIAGVRSLSRGWRSVLEFAVACVPVALLTIWYVAVRNNDAVIGLETFAPYFSMKFWAYKFYTLTKAGPYQNFMLGYFCDIDRTPVLYYVGVLVNSAFGLLLIFIQVSVFRNLKKSEDSYLYVASIILGLAYIFAPSLALQVVNPGERMLYPQLLCVFALGLRQNGLVGAAKRCVRWQVGVVYVFLMAAIINLTYATERQGYATVTAAEFADAKKSYLNILYWHRPYQYKELYDHFSEVYKTGGSASVKISPTSIIANKK